MRIALICEEAAGARILQNLSRSPHELALVLTSPSGPVWKLAERLGCRPQPARHTREPGFAAQLAAARVDALLNVHSLYILPEEVLRAPPFGAFNLHPGPLPEYAGRNVPSWALYHGETQHAVTVHRMVPDIDAGEIIYSDHFPILPEDTALSVALRCVEKGVQLLERLLEVLARDPSALRGAPQDLSRRRYFGRAVPQDGRIDWNMPARRIHDFVRACDYHPFPSPWGVPRARLGSQEIEVRKTCLTGDRALETPGTVRAADSALYVATADEWLCLLRWSPV